MDEAHQLCERIAIMDQGRIIDEGAPQDLIQKHIGHEVLEMRASEAIRSQILAFSGSMVKGYDSYRDLLVLYTDEAETVLEKIKGNGINTDYILVRRSSLEDVFLKLTGRRLTE
jgi:lipooligosaccharide transport system ATP-binding protein